MCESDAPTWGNNCRLTKEQHAASWLRVGELNGGELLGGVEAVLAARGDAVEVQGKCDSASLDWNGLCQPVAQRH